MKYEAKEFLKSILPASLINFIRRKQIKNWQRKGCPIPPPHAVKQNTIAACQQKSGYTTFIETGTFRGDMIQAQKKRFERLVSIELGTELFEKAKQRFKNDRHIQIVPGDSGEQLPAILQDINDPVIFWLDGHYSSGITAKGKKECPVLEELEAIFKHDKNNHIILIDDARCFTGENDYPSLEQLKQFIGNKSPGYRIALKNDIIYCLPKQFSDIGI